MVTWNSIQHIIICMKYRKTNQSKNLSYLRNQNLLICIIGLVMNFNTNVWFFQRLLTTQVNNSTISSEWLRGKLVYLTNIFWFIYFFITKIIFWKFTVETFKFKADVLLSIYFEAFNMFSFFFLLIRFILSVCNAIYFVQAIFLDRYSDLDIFRHGL